MIIYPLKLLQNGEIIETVHFCIKIILNKTEKKIISVQNMLLKNFVSFLIFDEK